jgi:hypothetical protein
MRSATGRHLESTAGGLRQPLVEQFVDLAARRLAAVLADRPPHRGDQPQTRRRWSHGRAWSLSLKPQTPRSAQTQGHGRATGDKLLPRWSVVAALVRVIDRSVCRTCCGWSAGQPLTGENGARSDTALCDFRHVHRVDNGRPTKPRRFSFCLAPAWLDAFDGVAGKNDTHGHMPSTRPCPIRPHER